MAVVVGAAAEVATCAVVFFMVVAGRAGGAMSGGASQVVGCGVARDGGVVRGTAVLLLVVAAAHTITQHTYLSSVAIGESVNCRERGCVSGKVLLVHVLAR